MSPFRLFSLQSSIQEKIMVHLEMVEIFRLSLCSKTAKEKFTTLWALSGGESVMRITKQDMGNDNVVELAFDYRRGRDAPGRQISVFFACSRDELYQDMNSGSIRIVNGNRMVFTRVTIHPDGPYGCKTEQPENDALILASYLSELFSCELDAFQLELNFLGIADMKKVLAHDILHGVKFFEISQGTVSHKEMRKILVTFKPKMMMVFCKTWPNFKCRKVIEVTDSLKIFDATWFKLVHLFKVRCPKISLQSPILTVQDLNEFVNQWLLRNDKTLEWLHITGCETLTSTAIDTPNRVQNFDPAAYRTSFHREGVVIDYTSGYTVIRNSDNTTATCVHFETGGHHNFLFVVWETA